MIVEKLKLYCFVILLFYWKGIYSQELPPIVKYSQNDYSAGMQNWMISQDSNRFLYFANNEGLLEFNGSNWNLYKSPNETIMRSVKVIDKKIYTGCYMEFGYWERKTNGRLSYNSLSKSIKSKLVDDEQFWNIIDYEQWVVFQSLNRIYIYDTKSKSFKIISPKNGILKSFKVKNEIYFQSNNDGLYEIESGVAKLVSNDDVIKNNKIVNIFKHPEGLIFQTQQKGFFRIENNICSKFNISSESVLNSAIIYSSLQLSDGGFAIGTISNGVFLLNANGDIMSNITQKNGLSNNTILAIYEDIDKNLWFGLDNGINCVNLKSPIKSYVDNSGTLGTVYTSILFNNYLYIGTNQGLFYKRYDDVNSSFTLIQNTKGQVWSLFAYDNTLFCGHDSGTYIINDSQAKLIFNQSGTWKFENIPTNKNIILQGNYFGLTVLRKVDGKWQYANKIKGFNYSTKYFEITNDLNVYISHEYKGIFSFKLDNQFTKANLFVNFAYPSKGKNASLTKYYNQIYYANKNGIYKLNKITNKFEIEKTLSSVFENDEYTSGKLIVDNSNKLWLFSKNYIHYFSVSKLGNKLKPNTIPIPASLSNSMLGYENIYQLNNVNYLIGTTDGYYIINIDDLSFKNYDVKITSITNYKINDSIFNCDIKSGEEFHSKMNNLSFSYTVAEFDKYINSEFQYKLEGFQDEWSSWSSKTSINFKNLPPNEYTFMVRARIGSANPGQIAEYKFVILKPWYATNLAIIIYIIASLLLARFINKAYKNYYKKQQEKLIEENNLLLEIKELENNQQLMKLRNEQLSQDVDKKNKELAVSTMNLIKKDELLKIIKDDLKNTAENESNRSIKSIITTINKNVKEEDTWNIFKEAFDNADKDFIKKMKQLHPNLTPNDLRLCAYLRLNLSSKEIAPLINISVRSVEIKRYRLRRKMDLQHEQGLVEYILSV